MRTPQLLIHESDGRLAGRLRELADTRGWTLREPRELDGCLRLLQRGGPGVLVIKLGRDLVREFTLLERVTWLRPEAATVVVGDLEDAVLAGLAWDLGAHYVLSPPLPRDLLPQVVGSLMARVTSGPAPAPAAEAETDA